MLNKRHLHFLAIITGAFLVPVNSTMITIGLSDIKDSFQINLANVSWIVTVYLIIMAVSQPISGKLGDIYGSRKMFLFGLLLFLGASLICIYAPNLPALIIGRAIQAMGGALIAPNGMAIIRFITPNEKLTKVFGVFGFVLAIGAAIGPLLGAALIGLWGWHSTFWVNIPLASLSFLIAYKFLPVIEGKKSARLDIQGSVFLGIFLSAIVLIVTNSWYTNVGLWIIFAAAFVLFIYREKRFDHPVVDFSLFKTGNFTRANISILLNNAIMYCTLLIMPMVLEGDIGFSIGSIGILLFFFSVGMSIASWLGGYLEGRIGKGLTIGISFGLSILALGMYFFIPDMHLLITVGPILFLSGLGLGLGIPSIQAASLESVAREMSGVASGIYSTFRFIGSIAASVIVSLQVSYWAIVSILIVLSIAGIFVSKGMSIGFISKGMPINEIEHK